MRWARASVGDWGQTDRVTVLPENLIAGLRAQLQKARVLLPRAPGRQFCNGFEIG